MVRDNMHSFVGCQWVTLHCWCRSKVFETFDCRIAVFSKTWSFYMLLSVRTLNMGWNHASQMCHEVWKKKTWLDPSTVCKGMWAPELKLGILHFPNLVPTTLAHAKHGFSFFWLTRLMPGPGLRLLPHYAKLIAGGARGPKEARDYAVEFLPHYLVMVWLLLKQFCSSRENMAQSAWLVKVDPKEKYRSSTVLCWPTDMTVVKCCKHWRLNKQQV